ncbi:RNA polymerase sigma factor [Nocardioides sp. zg-1308]|uniref:RNA polymerase sigma factor n=1 Tax=Nocardioides sp. zg-1308 TaxID=2736253 RepID=UPI001C13083A|nr:sigma-70 family RNA polymerase sigma factor [Nocardioides sp. zg-1308]
MKADAVAAALTEAHRSEWAFVLSATIRVAGDLDVAEECAQEAYVSALQAWTRDGIPERPGAWLTTAARNKALDRLRREATLRRKLPLLVEPATTHPHDPDDREDSVAMDWPDAAVPDDRLRLVFTCCHPTLAPEAHVALTLRLVCGVPTPDVARAFLVSESTMAARITRAKKKITEARIPYRVPSRAELPERLDSVLTAVHLLFSTGHTASEGDALVREDLCDRALHLARTLAALLPEQDEARGLLGLLLLTDARRATRTDDQGRLLLLADQDRTRWDHRATVEGLTVTARALAAGPPGRFALQAAIAGVHAVAPSFEKTDWPRIVHLYDMLIAAWDTPVVALNRAAAVAFANGPAAALPLLDELANDPRLADYPYLPATRADLLRRLGDAAGAAQSYRRAMELTANAAERAFLEQRLTEIGRTADAEPAPD